MSERDEDYEHRLAVLMQSYCNKSHGCYDPEFKTKIDKLYPPSKIAQNKQDLLELGRRITKLDVLYGVFSQYTAPRSPMYDSEFTELYERTYPGHRDKGGNFTKARILALKRALTPKDADYLGLKRFLAPSSDCYDPEFAKLYRELHPSQKDSKSKKVMLLGLGRRVTMTDELFWNYNSYTSPSNKCYDPEFAKLYDETYPSKRKRGK